MSDGDFTDNMQFESLRRLYRYWQERRGSRRMPARSDIDPADFRYALGNLFLIAVERDPLRFRYVVYATNHAARRGFDLTGAYVDEIPDLELRAFLLPIYERLVAEAKPFHAVRDDSLYDRLHHYEILALPLSADDREVDMLLVLVEYFALPRERD